jgi:hypothetical protein
MDASATHMQRPVGEYATQDFVQLGETMRVDEAAHSRPPFHRVNAHLFFRETMCF